MKQERFNELQRELAAIDFTLDAETIVLADRYLAKPREGRLMLVGVWHLLARIRGDRRWCYFVRGAGGAIKIGIAADPHSRLGSLQVASPVQIELLGVVPGGELAEAYLHHVLREDCIRGEWFAGEHTERLVAELLAIAPLTEAA